VRHDDAVAGKGGNFSIIIRREGRVLVKEGGLERRGNRNVLKATNVESLSPEGPRPLSRSSFSRVKRREREKRALGLLTPSLSVPARFQGRLRPKVAPSESP